MEDGRVVIKVGADISDFQSKMNSVTSTLGSTASRLSSIGKSMSLKITAPLIAIGAAATKAALSVDDAMDLIAAGTGAQGKDLRQLQESWKQLAVNVTQGFDVSAKVLADFNTRLGLTGTALTDISKLALDAARLLEEDVNTVVSQASKAMQDWGVSAQDAGSFMNILFAAAQNTGISMGTLATQLYKYGAALRGMGFDTSSATALLAQFEKQGVNTELILGSLRIGLGKLANEGIADAGTAFEMLIDKIKNAESVTEATKIAMEVFGTRAGPDLAMAIREGRFEIEELVKTLNTSQDAINKTSKATDGFAEQWQRTKNQVLLAIEPIGTEILGLAEKAMPKLQAAVSKVAEVIGNSSEETKNKLGTLITMLGVGGPFALAVSYAIKVIGNLGKAFLALAVGPGAPIVVVAAGIAGLIALLYEFKQAQSNLRQPKEVLERTKLSEQAGEIFYERHGKYPLTAQDYEEIEKIVDELISQSIKQRAEDIKKGAFQEPAAPTPTTPTTPPTPPKEPSWTTTDLFGPGNETQTEDAVEKARKQLEEQRRYAEEVYALTERTKRQQEELAEAAQAAARGVAKFWQEMAWEYQQGLLSAEEYFSLLKNEVSSLQVGTDEWRDRFAELQRVASELATEQFAQISESLRNGVITTEEFALAVEELVAKFEGLPLVLGDLEEKTKTALQNVGTDTSQTVDLVRDLGMTFQSAFENAIVGGQDLRSVVSGLLEDIARLILRLYVIQPLVNSITGMFSSFLGVPSVVMHGGGVVGSSGTMALAPAGLFVGAPKLHSGLNADEFPAILQRGETVLPKNFGGNSAAPNIKIINVLDPSVVGDYMSTYEGEKMIMNIVQRNSGRIV